MIKNFKKLFGKKISPIEIKAGQRWRFDLNPQFPTYQVVELLVGDRVIHYNEEFPELRYRDTKQDFLSLYTFESE